MSKSNNFIRSFGMSGYLITNELKSIEDKHGFELGHTHRIAGADKVDYYPQFEQSVRLEAAEMAKHYEVFYCLEIAIRKLISETFQDNIKSDWWNSGKIPVAISNDVKARIKKEIDSGVTRRSEAEIDYTTFGELADIITFNWDLFEPIFSSRSAVQKIMSNLNTLRAPIAHCCPITEDEVLRLRLAVKDWFRIIG